MDGFWRVYRAEWNVAHVSDADGEDGRSECTKRGEQSGVPQGYWRAAAWSETNPEGWPWMLEVRLAVLKGEHRDEAAARSHASAIGGTAVRENSPEDKRLQSELTTTLRRISG